MIPIIINSRRATKDLQHIRTQHSDILMGIADQQMKNEQRRMEKEQRQQLAMDQNVTRETAENANAVTRETTASGERQNMAKLGLDRDKMGLDKERMGMESEHKKMELENKRQELLIKQQALTMPIGE